MKTQLKFMTFFLIFISLGTFLFAGEGDSYEPETLTAKTDAPVMLYFKGIDIGFTSMKSNGLPDLEIKSTNKKKMEIVEFTSINLLEAIDANGAVSAYKMTKYTLSDKGKKKINRILKKGKVGVSTIIDKVNIKDLSQENEGSDTAPDPNKFVKLRKVYVYNFLMEDSEGNQSQLQVYIEKFTDSSDL